MTTIRFMKSAIALSLMLACSACNVFPKDFNPASGQSAMVFVDDMPTNGSREYIFRQIDLSTGRFVGDFRYSALHSMSFWRIGEAPTGVFSIMSDMKTSDRAQTFPPGDYAFVGMRRFTGSGTTTGGGRVETTTTLCLGKRAPIFSMRAGEVTIVPLQAHPASPEALASDFSGLRLQHPEIKGPARAASMSDHIAFGTDASDPGTCLSSSTFTKAQ